MAKLNSWLKKEDIEILMQDHCTRGEAIAHLNNGSIVIPIEEWPAYIEQFEEQTDDVEKFRKEWTVDNIKAGGLEDHSFVEYNGKEYIIEYVL